MWGGVKQRGSVSGRVAVTEAGGECSFTTYALRWVVRSAGGDASFLQSQPLLLWAKTPQETQQLEVQQPETSASGAPRSPDCWR